MIDPKLFTVEKLLAAMLNTVCGAVNKWWTLVEIIPDFEESCMKSGRQMNKCVVRCEEQYLRHSMGPVSFYVWDVYGDDFITPECALLAILKAPIPH